MINDKISKDEIRKDLMDFRYYYMYRKAIQEAAKYVGDNDLYKKIVMYNIAIQKVPIQLYNLYYNLYILGHTQESYSEKICFSPEYIQKLNRKLLNLLSSYLNNN